MSIKQIISDQVKEPSAGMWSNCLKVNDLLFISVLTSRDEDLKATGGDEYLQSCNIFNRMQSLIEASGGSMADIVKLTIFVTKISEREKVWRARKEFFQGVFPAASLVEVSGLAEAAITVEIEAIAVLNQGGRAKS